MNTNINQIYIKRTIYLMFLIMLILSLFIGNNNNSNYNESNKQLKLSAEAFIHHPILFEENVSRFSTDFPFTSRGPGFTIFLKPDKLKMKIQNGDNLYLIGLNLLNSNDSASIYPLNKQKSKTNYISASPYSETKIKNEIPSFSKVLSMEIYPGISVLYYGNKDEQFEYDFIVSPGANYKAIELQWTGISRLDLNVDGSLELNFEDNFLTLNKPIAYQIIENKKREVFCKYELYSDNTFGFTVGDHSEEYALIIDPVLKYSTFLGGNGNDISYDITVDKFGYTYITGVTHSTDFPTNMNAFDTIGNDGINFDQGDVFVTKIDTNGSDIIYSTYISGSGLDIGNGIVVDSSGCAFVVGTTFSIDDTTTPNIDEGFPFVNSFYTADSIAGNIFVLKLNEAGSDMLFSSMIGASNSGQENPCIAIDNNGDVYVAGGIGDQNFPTTINAFRSGGGEPFAVKINSKGSIEYSTQLGGDNFVFVQDIAVDKYGQAYITGYTGFQNLPTTSGAYKQTKGVNFEDMFIYKLNSDGSGLVYCTYLGGDTDDDFSYAIAVDNNGNAIVTGNTFATDYPITFGNLTNQNTIVTIVDSIGSSIVLSTEVSGFVGKGISVLKNGYLGITSEGPDGNFNKDVVLTILDPKTPQIFFETYMGGLEDDVPNSITSDYKGNVYVTGKTNSPSFPGEDAENKNPFQLEKNAMSDGFLIKYSIYDVFTSIHHNLDIPNDFLLKQNYPNPFNPSTSINYSIPQNSFVTIKVFDVLGSEVATLVNQEQPQGTYDIKFDSSNLTSGIYFYRLEAGKFVDTKRMNVLK